MAYRIDPLTRLQTLDLLRGMALLGMFVVHFHMRSTEPGGLDDWIRTFVWRFVETKSHGTFALLFGAGFAIQLRRAEATGRPFAARYLRRLAVLAVFGFAAHACFGFNVLLGYAVWGVPLLLIRTWSTRTLLVVALLSAMSVPLYRFTTGAFAHFTSGPDAVAAAYAADREAAVAVNGALDAAEEGPSYGVLFTARLRHMAWFYAQPFSLLPSVTLTLFIAGFLLIRHRVFEEVSRHRRLIGGMIAVGVVSWAVDNWLVPLVGFSPFGIVRDQWLTFAYLGVALLVLDRWPMLLSRLGPVSTAGRMALTNYLLQIAALDVLFSGYAIGLGSIRPMFGLAAALTCFAIEMVVSTLWLRRFNYGPAEWLWRSLTYGQRQPMRRSPALPDAISCRPAL